MGDHKHGESCGSGSGSCSSGAKETKNKPMQGGSCSTTAGDKGGKKGGSCS
jgi:hypothetical protein